MQLNRRSLLSAALAPVGAELARGMASAQSKPRPFRLRYAPRIGLVPNLPITRQLELYAEAGFTAFEYNGLPSHPYSEIETFRKKMDELKLSMGVFVVNRGGWRPTALPDRSGHRTFLEDVRKAVEIHKIIGNEAATVTTGLAVPHLTFAQQTANTVEALKRAAEIVEKTKLMLVLEPLNHKVDHAGYFVVYSEHAGEIIGSVNHPQVKILFDIYHQQISEGNIINHIHQYWDLIGYFQIGDVPGRKEPFTGELNYQNIFKAIHAKGYKGILGGEHGLSVPGLEGLKKCFEAYRKADSWEA
ncbi:MAG: TIM barrel protein [Bryobacteraceae bacterium]|nr:TIM barrel protein [Bryobacteraceae bacterium]MDW8377594.1 TIM barrel protein [Bryobacterales bacterium]